MKFKKTASLISTAILAMSMSIPPIYADKIDSEQEYKATAEQFCGDPAEMRVYNYCPSAIYYKDNVYVYFCANPIEGAVSDHIYLNTINTETMTYSEKKLMLSPSQDGWDKEHVCDPSVVSGSFAYNGSDYNYLMAYLGCDRKDVNHNQVGIAVAKELDGEWVKVTEINPIISADFDCSLDSSVNQWGVGQPSVINLDKNGTVAIFYTGNKTGNTCTACEIFDLSNLNSPKKISEFKVSNAGTTNGNEKPETITNADFAYSSGTGKIYMITDRHPFTVYPTIIADSSDIYETEIGDLSNIGSLEDCIWTKVDTVGIEKTCSQKNHNTGFLRTASGNLYTNAVLYTSADEILWSYRIGIIRFQTDEMAYVNDEKSTETVPQTFATEQKTTESETVESIEESKSEENEIAVLIPPETYINDEFVEIVDGVMNTGVENCTGTFIVIGSIAMIASMLALLGLKKERT